MFVYYLVMMMAAGKRRQPAIEHLGRSRAFFSSSIRTGYLQVLNLGIDPTDGRKVRSYLPCERVEVGPDLD